mmetsp:Transcript_4571/g.10329  ORF Transcript_4571/g.10329 Transcript_4571/m.10329 type:complete len:215 (-) Transcript_4571:1386-2030(-)
MCSTRRARVAFLRYVTFGSCLVISAWCNFRVLSLVRWHLNTFNNFKIQYDIQTSGNADANTTYIHIPEEEDTVIEPTSASAFAPTPSSIFTPADKNRSWALAHFREAGIELTNETLPLLPTDSELRELIGREPVIVGRSGPGTMTSQCEIFLRNVPTKEDRWIGVAGLFNTGTNLLYDLLSKNCQMPGGGGRRGCGRMATGVPESSLGKARVCH